jgi:hypothetical protein
MRPTILALALALFACATPYQANSAWSVRGGYETEQLGPDLFSVKASGNGYIRRNNASKTLS